MEIFKIYNISIFEIILTGVSGLLYGIYLSFKKEDFTLSARISSTLLTIFLLILVSDFWKEIALPFSLEGITSKVLKEKLFLRMFLFHTLFFLVSLIGTLSLYFFFGKEKEYFLIISPFFVSFGVVGIRWMMEIFQIATERFFKMESSYAFVGIIVILIFLIYEKIVKRVDMENDNLNL